MNNYSSGQNDTQGPADSEDEVMFAGTTGGTAPPPILSIAGQIERWDLYGVIVEDKDNEYHRAVAAVEKDKCGGEGRAPVFMSNHKNNCFATALLAALVCVAEQPGIYTPWESQVTPHARLFFRLVNDIRTLNRREVSHEELQRLDKRLQVRERDALFLA